MRIRVSTMGQIVLPKQLRRRLGICAGDPLEVGIEGERIVLTLHPKRLAPGRIDADPVSGLPVLRITEGAQVLTGNEVDEILANFP